LKFAGFFGVCGTALVVLGVCFVFCWIVGVGLRCFLCWLCLWRVFVVGGVVVVLLSECMCEGSVCVRCVCVCCVCVRVEFVCA